MNNDSTDTKSVIKHERTTFTLTTAAIVFPTLVVALRGETWPIISLLISELLIATAFYLFQWGSLKEFVFKGAGFEAKLLKGVREKIALNEKEILELRGIVTELIEKNPQWRDLHNKVETARREAEAIQRDMIFR